MSRHYLSGLVHPTLAVERAQEVLLCWLAARGCRYRLLGHIEEPLQVDGHGAVEDAPRQEVRRRTPHRLVHSVGIGERVMHGVPVRELIGGAEVHRPPCGRIGDGGGKLCQRYPLPHQVGHLCERLRRLGVQDGLGELLMSMPAAEPATAPSYQIVELCVDIGEERRKVDGMPPARGLLHPGGLDQVVAGNQGGQHLLGVLPADVVQ